MKKLFFTLLSIAVLSVSAFAQTPVPANKPQEIVITVNQPPQPQPAPVVQEKEAVQKAHEWVEFGSHVGGAMREGLSALTDEANKFAGTDAGRFTMLVIAWKVAGDDAMILLDRFTGVIFGVPTLIAWNAICIWYIRRMFVRHMIVVEQTGFLWWGTKKYKVVNDDSWTDNKVGGMVITAIVYVGISLILIFSVII